MSTEPEWVARNVRVEVHYGGEHPYGAVFIDGQMVPFCSRVQVDFVAGEAPKVTIAVDAPELTVDVKADPETLRGEAAEIAASYRKVTEQLDEIGAALRHLSGGPIS